uniref:Uncharacterized protein n=1 Tax=Anguilla anguilla TaxID=7936 RepID=A0A0E9W6B2_ANGAN
MGRGSEGFSGCTLSLRKMPRVKADYELLQSTKNAWDMLFLQYHTAQSCHLIVLS